MPETPSEPRKGAQGLEERFLTASPSTRHVYVDVHFLLAGVDVAVPHGLRPAAPDGVVYEVAQVNAPARIYHDTSAGRRAWTSGEVYLRSDTANVVARVLLTTSSVDAPELLLDKGPLGATRLLSGQLTFPATALPSTDANTLDDYVEGDAFTPSLTFGGAAAGMTYSTRVGSYTKVGNVVVVQLRVVLTAKGSSVGTAQITLPFATKNDSHVAGGVVTVGANLAGLTSAPTVYMSANTAIATFADWGATGAVNLDDTNFTNTSSFEVVLTYRTA